MGEGADPGVRVAPASGSLVGTVALEGPLDVVASLGFLHRNGDDLVDRFDGSVLARTLPVDGRRVPVAMRPVGGPDAPALEVEVGAEDAGAVGPGAVLDAAAAQFVTAHAELAALTGRDPALAQVAERRPALGLVRSPDLLHALVRSISAQQINLAWAATLRARLARLVGVERTVAGRQVWLLDADRLAGTPVATLRHLQFSGSKATYLVVAATAVADGTLRMEELRALPDSEVVARLTALRGLGRWSAEWFLARTLGRPVVVAGDLGVRKAVGMVYGLPAPPSEAETRRLTAHWGPAAAVAQQLVLEHLYTQERARSGRVGR
jgi:DNA-3-methyladenine glycosylase II